MLLTAKAAVPAAVFVLCLCLFSAAPAAASTVPVELRVEASGKALEPGSIYYTDTARFQTDTRPECAGSGGSVTVPGPTALGVLKSAAKAQKSLRPLAVSDQFEFGTTVCGIGGFFGFQQNYWLYRVNHQSPDVGADVFDVRPGDEVLWFFNEPDNGSNLGDELELETPSRVSATAEFEIQVWRYDADGLRTPAAGVVVTGAAEPVTTDAQGRASLRADGSGRMVLRATSASDIPAAPAVVCVEGPESCDSRGEQIFGSAARDRIVGTRGGDRIRAAGGDDQIRVVRGGADRVDCGAGRDLVLADRGDVIGKSCERRRLRG